MIHHIYSAVKKKDGAARIFRTTPSFISFCAAGPLRLQRCFSAGTESLHGPVVLSPLLLQRLLQDHILHLSKTLVQISTNSSKMTLFGRRVVTINLVERWLIHPNPGPVMSPLCQFSHPFLHLFPDYLRSDI